MTLLGKIDEYILQLENAVNQLRQENQQLQQALQQKTTETFPEDSKTTETFPEDSVDAFEE
jgi:prefoldin subunit 5